MKKQIISASLVIVGFLIGATALSAVAAWSGPGAGCTPPNCNVAAPVNVGGSDYPIGDPRNYVQAKTGLLGLNDTIIKNLRVLTSAGTSTGITGKALVAINDQGDIGWGDMIGGGGLGSIVAINKVTMEFNDAGRTNNYANNIFVTAQVRPDTGKYVYLEMKKAGTTTWFEFAKFEKGGSSGHGYNMHVAAFVPPGWSYRFRHENDSGTAVSASSGTRLLNIYETVFSGGAGGEVVVTPSTEPTTGSVGGGCYLKVTPGTLYSFRTMPWGNAIPGTNSDIVSESRGTKNPCVCPTDYTFGPFGTMNTASTRDNDTVTGICYKQ